LNAGLTNYRNKMFDFRLKVFLTVTQRMSFTQAADELFISQPAVSKHIKEIEKYYQCSLFERKGNLLRLTKEGELLKKFASKILALHQEMDAEMKFQNKKHHGALKIGVSTTASQYVFPKYLALFQTKYPAVSVQIKTGNTEEIEALILKNEIDFAIVEGKHKRSALNYVPFKKDEIVLCTNIKTSTPTVFNQISDLKKLPFILRENGSGTLEIIRSSLIKKKIKLDELNVVLVLENNESIKTYLQNSNAFAFISISAITNELVEKKLKIVDIEDFSMERYYYVITKTENQNPLSILLKEFLLA